MRIAWNKNATIKQNMKAMGLAYDSNKLFPLRPSMIRQVIAALEKEVEEEQIKQKKGRSYRLLARDIEFCVYMIERHGDDYEKMSRDAKNIYQDTPKQIQRKVRIFKESPEYSVYLKLRSQMM
uniref:Nucleolar protein 16 n=1 Tax=Elaeophora elaphi TaxID=1147741 RepID=A0A0R3RHG1_9BILA